MASQSAKVAFAGLGAMGYGMAAHLVKSGFAVTAFDVYQPALDRFTQEAKGAAAAAAKSPRDAAQGVDFFICMVANSLQATPLLFDEKTGAVKGLKENATIIICSTVAPAYIDEIQSLLKDKGRPDIHLIDSPVSGGAGRAADGTLSIFASGSKPHLDHARAILECMSGKLYEAPGGLGGGSKAKLIHQIFAGINIAMANEAMGLAAVAGLDTREVFEKLKGSDGSSWMFENRVPPMLDSGLGRYSAMTIIAKDVGIITQTSRTSKFPLPLLSTAEQLYLSAISAGWGAEDDCVLVRLYLPPSQPDLVAQQAGSVSDAPNSSTNNIHTDSTSSTASNSHSVTWEMIGDIMLAVHLASITEAMSFCEFLGIDNNLMHDIVSHAAGTSRAFEKSFAGMREKRWGVDGVSRELGGVVEVRERLAKAVEEVRGLGYPLFLGGAALQEFWRQGREG